MRVTVLMLLVISLGISPRMDAQKMVTFISAEKAFHAKQYSQAEVQFKQLLKKEPNNPKIIEYLGDIAGYHKDWDTAIDYYELLVNTFPKVANYHYKRGGALGMKALGVNKFHALTLIDDIRDSFAKAAELDPKHIDVRWALIEFHLQLPGILGGSVRKAKESAEELAQISKVDGLLAKGYIAEYEKLPKDAERFYMEAVKVGGSLTCYAKLSEHYENNGQPEKALETVANAQRSHSGENRLCYQFGKIASQYGVKLEEGIHCLKSYIKNHTSADGVPKDWAYLRLAQIYKIKKEKQQALYWIDKALDSRSDFEEAIEEEAAINKL